MWPSLMQRVRDMRTIKALCQAAEKHACAEGMQQPGAEHFVMAALELPDGTAKRVFQKIGADPGAFRPAVARQYDEALSAMGLHMPGAAARPVPPAGGIYETQASAQVLMQGLAALDKGRPARALSGAHVLLAALAAEYGVVPRALQSMGVAPDKLADAARETLAAEAP